MLPVKEILESLEAINWDDGEELSAIKARLTDEQIEAPGRLIIRISKRGSLPWLLCGRVEQAEMLLFEVKRRLPPQITRDVVENAVKEWQALGYLETVTIRPINPF